ncbi:chaperone DnaJ-domain superfamily protein [Tasmannia lanceolata]|uniref:chaperone DnaJ-domain superfamily protein n=1 Tax=Tasmannia lanceolata TaxID=3420 RepID=UPI0040632283
MSRGQSRSRTQSGRRNLERFKYKEKFDNVVIIDIDKGKSHNVVIIDVPESSQQCPSREIISIDDDDVGNHGPRSDDNGDLHSDATSSKKLSRASSQSHVSKESDNEDCQIFNQERDFAFKLSKCKQKCPGKGPSRNCFGLYIDPESNSSESDSSDCEVIEGSPRKIREQWEKAALRKKVLKDIHNSRFGVEDQASASGSNTEPRNCSHKKIDGENITRSTYYRTTEQYTDGSVCSSSSNAGSENEIISQDKEEPFPGESSLCNAQSQCGGQVNCESANCQDKERAVSLEPQDETQGSSGRACLQGKEELVNGEPSLCGTQPQDETPWESVFLDGGITNGLPGVESDLIGGREKHKETDEFRRASEEEWASRQKQLQIQAEEVQRLRKRKKAETLRLLDMERRQKQRLEEMRESQKKDEETINLKEQLRVEIREELDKLELKYRDMASLLRVLGIHVRGGPYPMSHEVNAAYKQALLKFHPDRSSKSDIRQQVNAEETFKLISRLKEKLQPTAA